MTSTLKATIIAALTIPALCLGVAAVACFVFADGSPRSEAARRVIAAQDEVDSHYYPDDALLSDRGLALRRRGNRMLKWAAGLVGTAFVVLMIPSH